MDLSRINYYSYAGTVCSDRTVNEKLPSNDFVQEEKISISNVSVKDLKSSYVYTGKVIEPSIRLMLNGKALSAEDYSITYKKNKSVGLATVIVTGKNAYTGIVQKQFRILPKETKINKLSAGKKKITIKWKQQTLQTKGYEISYSLKKNMKSAKTIKISNTKTTSKTVKNLKSKKTYYIRIRTYKKVNGKMYVSSWSKVKSVKVK